jgi:hypothetical protein
MENHEKNQKSGRARLLAAHAGPWQRVPASARPPPHVDAVGRPLPGFPRRRPCAMLAVALILSHLAEG